MGSLYTGSYKKITSMSLSNTFNFLRLIYNDFPVNLEIYKRCNKFIPEI